MKERIITGTTITRIINALNGKGITPVVRTINAETFAVIPYKTLPNSMFHKLVENHTVEISFSANDGDYAFALDGGMDFIAASCTNKRNEMPCLDLYALDEYMAEIQAIVDLPVVTIMKERAY